MTTRGVLCVALCVVGLASARAHAQDPGPHGARVCCGVEEPETIAEIRVHGNHTTPEADILALAALVTGESASEARLAEAEDRLRASRRFAGVEIRRRYRSISDRSEILVILIVDEHDAVTDDNLIPGPLARLRSAGMWLPILGYADGYGLTYGARVSVIEPFGSRSRLSVPLTWGGERKAAMEIEQRFGQGVARGSAGVSRRVNPHYDLPDARREIAATIETAFRPWLRAGANGRVGRVTFGPDQAWHQAAGVQLTVDTRVDPSFPRNAVHATIGLDQIRFGNGSAARASADVRGYAALGGSMVLVLRGAIVRAGAPLPPSEQVLVGGSGTLRGYRAGHLAGDGLALLSAETRVPLTSPLSVGRFGVKAFVDAGTTWDAGTRLRDRRFERGIGGGVYFGATVVTANVDVAWPEAGKPRVHAALGVQF
jgi:outer membrane protein assembly factor BamA